MKISTRGRYALTIMIDIARGYSKNKYISISEIAEEENISQKYLEKIASLLKKNNLLESTTGIHGGYRLVKPPSEYKIGDIIKASDEKLEIIDCINNTCPKKNNCKTYPLWEGLDKQVKDYLDSKSLEEYL